MKNKTIINVSHIPQVNRFVNMSELDLTPEEHQILSYIDGITSIDGLALRHSVMTNQMISTLQELSGKGVVDFLRAQDMQDATAALYEEVVINPYELSEEVDLTRKEKKRIIALYQRLDQLNYYQLLDVVTDADRSAIKQAFITVYKRFIPTDWRERDLGSYRHKVVTISTVLKEAYAVLHSKKHRLRYDQKLGLL